VVVGTQQISLRKLQYCMHVKQYNLTRLDKIGCLQCAGFVDLFSNIFLISHFMYFGFTRCSIASLFRVTGIVSTIVQDTPHKVFVGCIPNYLNEDQVCMCIDVS